MDHYFIETEEKLSRTHNLFRNIKMLNYFLKISNEGIPVNEKSILNKIQEIPQIVATAYSIDATN